MLVTWPHIHAASKINATEHQTMVFAEPRVRSSANWVRRIVLSLSPSGDWNRSTPSEPTPGPFLGPSSRLQADERASLSLAPRSTRHTQDVVLAPGAIAHNGLHLVLGRRLKRRRKSAPRTAVQARAPRKWKSRLHHSRETTTCPGRLVEESGELAQVGARKRRGD